MQIDMIFGVIYSAINEAVIVSMITGLFYLYGLFFMKALRLPNLGSHALVTAIGVITVTYIGWYCHTLGILMTNYLLVIFGVGIILLGLYLRKMLTQRIYPIDNKYFKDFNPSFYLLPLFASLLSIQSMIAFHSVTPLVGTNGNEDIYYWSLMADKMLGNMIPSNIFPGSSYEGDIDSWGTYFLLGTVSKWVGITTIESTPYFIVFSLSLISMSIFELIRKIFKFNTIISFLLTFLVSAGSFMFYIAYNNFYSELLATFMYLVGLWTIMQVVNKSFPLSFLKSVLLITLPLLGILLVYQSGFLVFSVFELCYLLILVFCKYSKINSRSKLFSELGYFLLIFMFALFLSFMFLPEIAFYLFKRIPLVAGSPSGWPLPLISPLYLFSIPVPQLFPKIIGQKWDYFFAVISVVLLIYSYYRCTKKEDLENLPDLIGFIVFFCFSLVIYFLIYLLKGDIYQVWKFSAYVLLPIGFLFLGLVVLDFNQIFVMFRLYRFILLITLILGAGFVLIQTRKSEILSISNEINQLKLIKKKLNEDVRIQQILLATNAGSETVLAYNLLEDQYRVFPLAKAYLSNNTQLLLDERESRKTGVLVKNKCYPDFSGISTDKYKVISVDSFRTFNSNNFLFSCGSSHSVILKKGFTTPEAWGIWTNGSDAYFQVNISEKLRKKHLRFIFKVTAFVGNGSKQPILLRVNGQNQGAWTLDGSLTSLNVDLSPIITDTPFINFHFHTENPKSPHDLDPLSRDGRLLGIGFIDFSLSNLGN